MLEDEELDAVALESTRTIDIDCFVPADSIGWIWYDKPHYLVPDDKVGEEAFSVIREAMVNSKTYEAPISSMSFSPGSGEKIKGAVEAKNNESPTVQPGQHA